MFPASVFVCLYVFSIEESLFYWREPPDDSIYHVFISESGEC